MERRGFELVVGVTQWQIYGGKGMEGGRGGKGSENEPPFVPSIANVFLLLTINKCE